MLTDTSGTTSVDLFAGTSSTDQGARSGSEPENQNLLSDDKNQTKLSKESKADESAKTAHRDKQVEAWVAKGPDALKELPQDKEWLRPFIEAKFKAKEQEPEIDQIVDRKLAEKESERKYQVQLEALRSMKLKGDQQAKVNERFSQLEGKMSKDEALTIAMEAAGISLDPEEQTRSILRQRMSVPAQGDRPFRDEDVKPDDPDFHKKVTDPKQKMRILMEHMRSPN